MTFRRIRSKHTCTSPKKTRFQFDSFDRNFKSASYWNVNNVATSRRRLVELSASWFLPKNRLDFIIASRIFVGKNIVTPIGVII